MSNLVTVRAGRIAATRSRDDRIEHTRERFRPHIHNEYYHLDQPEDWTNFRRTSTPAVPLP